MKLNLGCGFNKLAGYVNVDIRKEVSPDVVCDIQKLLYPDNSVDEIFASHLLEHIGWRKVDEVLKEWYRVLKPEGYLKLILPNMKFLCTKFLQWEETDNMNSLKENMKVVYGNQDYPYNFHYFGYTPKLISFTLSSSNFKIIEIKDEIDLKVIALKNE